MKVARRENPDFNPSRNSTQRQMLTKYILDFTTCSLCGSCVESCNFNALEYSKEYNLASTRKEDFIFDLLKRLEDRNA